MTNYNKWMLCLASVEGTFYLTMKRIKDVPFLLASVEGTFYLTMKRIKDVPFFFF